MAFLKIVSCIIRTRIPDIHLSICAAFFLALYGKSISDLTPPWLHKGVVRTIQNILLSATSKTLAIRPKIFWKKREIQLRLAIRKKQSNGQKRKPSKAHIFTENFHLLLALPKT